MKTIVVLALASMLAGCGNDDDTAQNAATATAAATAAPPPARPIAATPLPEIPDWAKPIMGKNATQVFAQSVDCEGAFDGVYNKQANPIGAQANGWGWLKAAKTPVRQVIFTDHGGTIVGAGSLDYDRPDVPAALTFVTTPHVGWHGVILGAKGRITVDALIEGKSACVLGAKDV